MNTPWRAAAACAGSALLALAPVWAGEAEEPAAFDDGAIYQIHYPEWFKQSFLGLPEDLADAAAAGKQGLFLFFTTQGCSYCHRFIEQSLGDPEIAARLRERFDTIGLEIFSDAEMVDLDGEPTRVKNFAMQQGVEFAPTLLFVDTGGERLLRLTGYYGPERFRRVLDYLAEPGGTGLPLREYLAGDARSGAGPEAELPADPLFSAPPYALDRTRVAAERPLLVLFEAAGCARCARFHDEVLSDDDIRETLAGFDVIRLEAADAQTPVLTPQGARTTPAAWYDALGFTQLPALVFFSEDGARVLETDALVLQNRMKNSLGFVTDRAFERGWTYQRYARSQALQKGAD